MSAFLSASEPPWSKLPRRRPAGVSERYYAWLKDSGSLTRRIIGACQGDFQVRVRHQGWASPLVSERRLLKMRRSETAVVREVELLCNGIPWVFARTLIPASSLSGGARRLAYLGNRPLGAVLFADPTTRRERVEIARLQSRHPLFAAATDHLSEIPDELWGRRTLFFYADRPILVNEIFLPGLPECRSV